MNLWVEILASLGLLIMIFLAMRWRRVLVWGQLGALAVLLVFVAGGCIGSGGSTIANPNGTPAGTYSITVTGTSGSTTQSTTISLTVT